MFKIDNDTRLLKHNVLQRVSELAYQGKLCDDTIQEIPFEQIPGRQPHFRCCVYKEREIIHQRVRLAMGKMHVGAHRSGVRNSRGLRGMPHPALHRYRKLPEVRGQEVHACLPLRRDQYVRPRRLHRSQQVP